MQAITAKRGKLYFTFHGDGRESRESGSPYNSREIFEHYWRKSIFGDFRYAPALRPDIKMPFLPREGYVCTPPSRNEKEREYTLEVAVHAGRIMEVFLGLVSLLGDNLSMVLEEIRDAGEPKVYQNDRVEKVIAVSRLIDYEDACIGDGFSGIGFFCEENEQEIFLDEHKLINVYAPSTSMFADALERFGISRMEHFCSVREHAHFHFRTARLKERIESLKRAFVLDSCNVAE